MSKDTMANNPAERLLRLFQRIGQLAPATPSRNGWAGIVGVDPDDTPNLLVRVGMIVSLVDATRRAVTGLKDIDHALFLRWEGPVRRALAYFSLAQGHMNEFQAHLAPEALAHLEHCSHELGRRSPEGTLDPQELSELIEQVKTLIADVAASDLPDDLRRFMLDKLDLILRAMEMYQFTGIGPIATALDTIIGATVRSRGATYTQAKDTPLGKRFWDICSRIAVSITITRGAGTLLEYLKLLLK